MSRSGYSDNCENLNLFRGSVERAINGKRGQAFLQELAKSMDEMPLKRLIARELKTSSGEVCAIGVVCKARGLDVSGIDVEDPESVGKLVGISWSMVAEIEFENDESNSRETPEERWTRMRRWVQESLLPV